MSIKAHALSGVRWTTTSSLVRAGLQFVCVLILARLLVPHDFGLFAVVTAIMSFLQIFADMGISNAIIYHRVISEVQLSSLYWLNVGTSLVLAIILASASPLLASFYKQPELQPLMMLSAVSLFITALGQQIRVVAEKNLRFCTLAKVEIAGAVSGLVAAIFVALMGGGVYSFLAGNILSTALVTALLWIYLSDGWRPMFVFDLSCIRDFLGFGAYMICNSLVNTFNSQMDVLVAGRILGAEATGLFSLPRDLCLRLSMVINPIMTRVGQPLMAKSNEDIAMLRKVYLRTLRMSASVGFPIYVAIFSFSPEIVQLFFGPRWSEAASVLRILAAWALIRSMVNNPIGMLCMGIGRPDLNLKWNGAMFFVFPPALLIGARYGMIGLASALLVSTAIVGIIPVWYFIVRPNCDTAFWEYHAQILLPLTLSIVSGVVGYLSVILFEDNVLRFTMGVATGGGSYLLLSKFFNKTWFRLMRELLGAQVQQPGLPT